jgi:hypothetical protein
MAQHYLTERAAPSQYLDVISQIGGLQAQVMSAAELALFARVDDISPDFVQNALWQDRTLVKTWVNRGTLHIITAKDFPIFVATLSTLRHYERESWQKYFGVTLDQLNSIMDGLQVILTDSGITREELADRIADHLNAPALREHLLSGWGSLLKPPSYKGYLCYGPNVTFVRPSAWIGEWEPIDSDEALQEVARRFLAAYGPATTNEFARWIGLTGSQAKKAFKKLGDDLEPVSVDGWEAYMLVSSLEQMKSLKAPNIVRLLPLFDPYTIAVAKHHEFLMPPQHKMLVYRNQGWISAVVLVDGRFAGVWERDKKSKSTIITVKLFGRLTKAIKQGIESEAERLNKFMSTEIELAYTEI